MYSNDEKYDMILTYDECKKNAVAARVYATLFTGRRASTNTIFKRLEADLRKDSSYTKNRGENSDGIKSGN